MKKAILLYVLTALVGAGPILPAYASERAQIDRMGRKQLEQQQKKDQEFRKLQQDAAKAISKLRDKKPLRSGMEP